MPPMPTQRQKLQATEMSVEIHVQIFKDETATCNPESSTQPDHELAKNLQVRISNVYAGSRRNDEASITFPIRTGIPTRKITFVGREHILHDINTNLQRASCGPVCCVLHGMGGVGKTETALEFTYVYRKDYGAISWLPAERGPAFRAAFAQIAVNLGLGMYDEHGDYQKASAINSRKWLEQTSKSQSLSE